MPFLVRKIEKLTKSLSNRAVCESNSSKIHKKMATLYLTNIFQLLKYQVIFLLMCGIYARDNKLIEKADYGKVWFTINGL